MWTIRSARLALMTVGMLMIGLTFALLRLSQPAAANSGSCSWLKPADASPDWGKQLDSYDGYAVCFNGLDPLYYPRDAQGNPQDDGAGIPWQCVELIQRYFHGKW